MPRPPEGREPSRQEKFSLDTVYYPANQDETVQVEIKDLGVIQKVAVVIPRTLRELAMAAFVQQQGNAIIDTRDLHVGLELTYFNPSRKTLGVRLKKSRW